MLFTRQVYVIRCFPVIFWLISFLPVAVQGKYHLAGSEGPIKAQVGSDAVLPCIVEPPVDVRDAMVEWMFNFSKTVHLFRNGGDDGESQDESFKGRTSLNHKMLEHGNASLTLADVTKNDAGIYTCIVLRLPGHDNSEERNIILVVVDGEENENPDSRSGGGTGDNNNGTHPGVVVGGVLLIILIIICAVCWWKRKQIFPRRSNNSRHEQRRNDGGMEMEELQNHRGNGNQGDEAEEIHLRIQEEPN